MHREHVNDRLAGGHLVGIFVSRTADGRIHAGIAFRWRNQEYIYHQAFHHITRFEPFDTGVTDLGGATLVITLPLPRDKQFAAAGLLASMARADPQFPYSLKYDPDAWIDPNIGRLVTKDGKGLSCTTFVLAVLFTARVRLIDGATWPTDRPKDLEAQQQLIDMLESWSTATAEHKQAVRDEKGCMRVRPEEAGGAACYTKWPTAFPEAEMASLHILKRISQRLGVSAWQLYPEAN